MHLISTPNTFYLTQDFGVRTRYVFCYQGAPWDVSQVARGCEHCSLLSVYPPPCTDIKERDRAQAT